MTEQYDNRGQIALWGKREDASPNAPVAKGHFFAHRDIKEGEKIEVALWLAENPNGNPNAPKMKGKISDPYQADGNFGGSQPAAAPAPTSAPAGDLDIPF
jgi:hypothetical protein